MNIRPTDDELVEMMCNQLASFAYGAPALVVRVVLARIRPLLEARGIEMAADRIRNSYEIGKERIADNLVILARQHAGGPS